MEDKMRVSMSCCQTMPYVRKDIRSNAEDNVEQCFLAQEKVKTEDKQKNCTDIWKELSNQYDIRNATIDELCDITLKLYKAGEISLFDHAFLSFDLDKALRELRIRFNIPLPKTNIDGKKDWIAEYEARANMHLERGDIVGYKNMQRMLGILRRLQKEQIS